MVLNRRFIATAFGGILLFSGLQPANAAFLQIITPNPAYTGSTNLIPIPVVPTLNTTTVTTLSGSGQTLTFSSPDPGTLLFIQPPVPVGFATYNFPPFVETHTPPIIQDQVSTTCGICTLNIAFATPVKTFGVELEPDPLTNVHTITETFLNGATTVGTISKSLNGNSSAMLFAGTTPDQQFTSVSITIDGTDFALAQPRFSTAAVIAAAVPEPGTTLLLTFGLIAIGYRKFKTVR
ncbi:MAG: PEP-CTERM sorting domain-containing protein [Acidobacteriota bacterium]|nr:PEP-CTERM sorting domain-containing protein [Acidobacteriota bacterium]